MPGVSGEADPFQNAVESAVADRFSTLLQAINTGLNPVAPTMPQQPALPAGQPGMPAQQPHTLSAPLAAAAVPASAPEISRQDVQEIQQGQQRLVDEVHDFQSRWESRPELRALGQLSERIDELKSLILESQTVQPTSFEAPPATQSGLATEAYLNGGGLTHDTSADTDSSGSQTGDEPDVPSSEIDSHVDAMRIVLLTSATARDDDEPLELLREWRSPGTEESSLDLRQMLNQREQYIDWLGGQVASIAGRINDWMEDFAARQVTSDEADKLKQVRQLLLAEHRTHQVKLSVERGRLFREQSQLQQEMANIESARDELEIRRNDCMHALEQLQQHGTTDSAVISRLTRFFKRQE